MSATVLPGIVPWRFPFRLAALAVVLFTALAAELLGWPALYDIVGAAFAVGLILTRAGWIGRRGGGVALVLAAGAILGTAAAGGDLIRIAAAAARMSDVIILILAVALIRPALAALKLDHAIAALVAQTPRSLRGCAVVLGAAIFGLGLSFGAVSIIGGSLRGRTNDDAKAARAAMRGLALSMLIGPSTASVAAVMAAYPRVSWGDALLVSLPIVAGGVALAAVGARNLTISAAPASRAELIRALMAILGVPAGAAIMHFGFGFSIIMGIAASAVGVAMLLLVRATREAAAWPEALGRFDRQITTAWGSASAETALFLACGLVLGAMREPALAEAARAFIVPVLPGGLAGLLFLLVAVPLVTTLGLHPMALFAILGPVMTPALLGLSEPRVFQAWIVSIGLAMIVSPASILTVTTVSGFGVPAGALCLRGNGLYALGLAIIATAALFI